MKPVTFRISSGLKSIIGRELITDDFIAVFELVKNSFDAGAQRVDITFDDLRSESASLTICDDGKGMDRTDILDKWLFVAYSAKKEGTEDYRDRIRTARIFAGAKGIGRFSCDKLGRQLELLTRKRADGAVQRVTVDWSKFENNAKEEFVRIPASLGTTRSVPARFTTGVILRITDLREAWERAKLLRLRRSLEKLINPNQGDDIGTFSIHLHVPDEVAADRPFSDDEPWQRVNGKIKNVLFEALRTKATSIRVTIPSDGATIVTRLEDRGRYIYESAENNSSNLESIEIDLFALNQSAKTTFARRMGVRSVEYGSVFLFKNGFRIHPFGDERGDSWGIDRRKQQGQARFLGTRDLLGRVEIRGDNPEFQEASSRDGGLIRTPSVDALRSLVMDHALRRLERFAVDVIRYGNYDDAPGEIRAKTLELLLGLTKRKALIDIHYGPKAIDILREASEKSLLSVVSQFGRLAVENDDPRLLQDVRRAERRIRQLEKARKEAEAEATRSAEARAEAERSALAQQRKTGVAEKTARKAERRANQVDSQNLFLQSVVSIDADNLLGMQHHIGIAAGTIQNYVQAMTKRIRDGKPVTTDMFVETLGKIALQASQIESSSRFATKAGFNTQATRITTDIVAFIREYVENVCSEFIVTKMGQPMRFDFSNAHVRLVRPFRPLEVVVLIDNLVSNARKAGARLIRFGAVRNDRDGVTVRVGNDGVAIPRVYFDKIFQIGFSRTKGSGFGLHHARRIAEGLGGSLEANRSVSGGSEFVWEIVV